MHRGYIKLYRKLAEWEWYKDIPVRVLFEHCLIKANIKDKNWKGLIIKQGSFVSSLDNLAFETGLSKMQVRTALKKLKSTHEITHKTTHQYSIIIVNNWHLYQPDNTQDNTQITHEQHTNNTQITLTKEYKNEKNEKNIYLAPEKKKTDPFYHSAILEYEKQYKSIVGKRCYLDAKHRNKIIELNADIENFIDTLPIVFKRLKFIKFDKIGFIPNSSWLLKEDNYIKVLEGTFGTKEKEEEYVYNAYN